METGVPVLELSDLHKSYGDKQVLRGANLQVSEGLSLALVGKNGAGKTTLMEIIMGLRFADAGQVRLFGHSALGDEPALRSRIGFLSETIPFYDDISAGRLLDFHRQFYRQWDAATEQALCHRLQIDLAARVNALSRGEKLRLGLVTALAHHPALLILDEVSAGMDPLVREQLNEILKEAVETRQTTILFATNLLYTVPDFSSHVVFLDQGRLSEPVATSHLDGDLEQVFVDRFRNLQDDDHASRG